MTYLNVFEPQFFIFFHQTNLVKLKGLYLNIAAELSLNIVTVSSVFYQIELMIQRQVALKWYIVLGCEFIITVQVFTSDLKTRKRKEKTIQNLKTLSASMINLKANLNHNYSINLYFFTFYVIIRKHNSCYN